ncbi:serine/threonine protein phosphatase [Aminipila butyrica]|uniref:Serine/threonine protein phosphatase n=1 Tax=Aminipila butyrica TaxID=433296 RepID=A0A858BXD0_9FIRM|nr:metallophosphoesterase [Aminipila butyrica]QIB69829.1 serine/threonine protein phosphatase [Aminipila butyrica]
MKIFAIADLHLSFDSRVEKPMDIFGGQWVNHTVRVKENWEAAVTDQDLVLIPGDISWALKREEALADFEWIHQLPGKKVITKGNHDLWWNGIAKLNQLYEDIFFLQNTFYAAGDLAICGSRGWLCPGSDEFDPHDNKIYERELLRLDFSLSAAKKAGFQRFIGMLHYPPTNDRMHKSGFTELFAKYGVEKVVYGHLHGQEGYKNGFKGVMNGVEYKLVSLDYLQCKPLQIV